MKGWKDIKAVWFEFEFTSYMNCEKPEMGLPNLM